MNYPQYVGGEHSLLNSLQQGGYILYARHGEANVGMDQPYLDLNNCYTQRNLSDTGRRQAILYGDAIRRLQIPIEYPVHASPLCRTSETASLAFGGMNVQLDPIGYEINQLGGHLNWWDQERILNNLQSVLEIPPSMGKNKVIIAHSFPKGVGLGNIPYMGTVVVKPLGKGNGYEIVARIPLEQLQYL
ncbi:histidine phosphatase family protein [Rummeliibacillus pycnus]|uniref:histidine phosphatase family protein n=1 Tax=Rummeliibacillus pycnus TaxID=101070 RepID=UPI0037C6DB98